MSCDKKRWERVIFAGALTSFVFVCGVLMHEGIQMVANERNGPSETTTGTMEANLSVGESKDVRGHAETDIHNSVSAKETEAAGDDKRQAVRKEVMSGRETVCLPSGSIVRGFGWQEEGGVWRYHTGIDVAVKDGKVWAAAEGTVQRIVHGVGGYVIEIAAQDKQWLYEPLDTVSVAVGDSVRIGEYLGRVVSASERLHIACRRADEWLDPMAHENKQKQP